MLASTLIPVDYYIGQLCLSISSVNHAHYMCDVVRAATN